MMDISKRISTIKSNVNEVSYFYSILQKGLSLIKNGNVQEGKSLLYNTVSMAVTFMEINKGSSFIRYAFVGKIRAADLERMKECCNEVMRYLQQLENSGKKTEISS